jgi:polar amino acid transport system permease protein
MMMDLNFLGVLEELPFILGGLTTTLILVLSSIIFGTIFGTVLSLMKLGKSKILSGIATVYISIFRGTPLMLQLTLIFFALPIAFNVDLGSYGSAILAMGLNSSAYVAEIIRSGISAVDKGQTEASLALGIPYSKMMKSIILPQALKNILPALINEFSVLIKESAIVNVVALSDLMRRAMLIGTRSFLYFETLIVVGVIYYVLVMILALVGKYVEGRLAVSD